MARNSARLQKRPRISYADSEDGDLGHDIDDYESDFGKPAKKGKPNTKKVKHDQKRAPFRWVDLPGELRNTIYKECLASKDYIKFEVVSHNGFRILQIAHKSATSRPEWVPHTSILKINKSTYNEAISILYQNRFAFISALTMWMFLTQISPAMKAAIRNIYLLGRSDSTIGSGSGYPAHLMPAITCLSSLKSLTSFRVQVVIFRSSVISRVATNLLRECKWWVDAVCREKGDRAAALDILDLECVINNGYWNSSQRALTAEEVRTQLYSLIREKIV